MKEVIKDFMGATGNLPPPHRSKEELIASVKARIKFLQEEIDELQEAVDTGNVIELVDAIADVEVFHQQNVIDLEAMGIDYQGALQAVGDNNRLKYSPSREVMVKELEKWYHVDADYADSLYIDENYYDGETYYCLKDINSHKVKKHVSFPSVNLREFISKEMW